ncbi:MAG: HD domain-containing protein [Candidatus Nanoarchaeia archaeon]|nr:HD domain-containing protein [Candidatus Nanoarchaeia archaeon]
MVNNYNWDYMDKLEDAVRLILQSPNFGHDFQHHKDVWGLAKRIDEGEGVEVDMEVVYAGCMFHDTGYAFLDPDDPKQVHHPERSKKCAQDILPQVGFPNEKIEAVLEAILLHDDTKPFMRGRETPTEKREIWYLQDADSILGLGAIGIARIIEYCTNAHTPLYVPSLSFDDVDSGKKSAIHNVYRHAVEVYQRLHTKTAKEMVKEKSEYMINFVKMFVEESKITH